MEKIAVVGQAVNEVVKNEDSAPSWHHTGDEAIEISDDEGKEYRADIQGRQWDRDTVLDKKAEENGQNGATTSHQARREYKAKAKTGMKSRRYNVWPLAAERREKTIVHLQTRWIHITSHMMIRSCYVMPAEARRFDIIQSF